MGKGAGPARGVDRGRQEAHHRCLAAGDPGSPARAGRPVPCQGRADRAGLRQHPQLQRPARAGVLGAWRRRSCRTSRCPEGAPARRGDSERAGRTDHRAGTKAPAGHRRRRDPRDPGARDPGRDRAHPRRRPGRFPAQPVFRLYRRHQHRGDRRGGPGARHERGGDRRVLYRGRRADVRAGEPVRAAEVQVHRRAARPQAQGGVRRPHDLGSPSLESLLLLVLRNATTDSPWPISNNPFAKYNDPGARRLQSRPAPLAAGPGQHRGAHLLPARGDQDRRRTSGCSSMAASPCTTTPPSSCS